MAWSAGALVAVCLSAGGLAIWPLDAEGHGPSAVLTTVILGASLLLMLAALLQEFRRHGTSRAALQASERALAETSALLEATQEHRVQADQRLAHVTSHDELTQVFNTAKITERLEKSLADPQRSGGLALLYVALDGFTKVNQVRGRAVGDLLLIEAAQRMQASLRERDAVGRMGEDLFVLVLQGVSSVEQARRSAQRLAAVIREPYTIEGAVSRIDASVGVAMFPMDGQTAEELLRWGRDALDRTLATGRSAVTCTESNETRAEAALLQQDLVLALELEQFEMMYQPILETRTGAVLAFEAMVRWRHPTRGVIPAAVFMPLCEQSGMIEKLGRWVMHAACTEAATWAMPVRLAINLWPEQFRRGDLAQQVIETLHHSGLAPDRLDLEVSESVLLEHSQQVLATMLSLRTLGVRLVLDDFGEANISLTMFRDSAFQQIKINRSSIGSMLSNSSAMAIVRTVLDMAFELRIEVVAEGVEEQVQLDMLTHLGCSQVQGTLLGPAQSPERTRQYLWQVTRRIDGGSVLLSAEAP